MGINLLPSIVLMRFFGIKQTLGLVLLIFIISDFLAIWKYRKTVEKKVLLSVLPWGLLGLMLSGWVGAVFSEEVMSYIIVAIIVYLVASIVLQGGKNGSSKKNFSTDASTAEEMQDSELKEQEHSIFLSRVFYGTMSGIATTMANFAGGLISLYFLKIRLKKDYIIGTAAVIFLVFNAIKIAMHFFYWKSADTELLYYSMTFWPWCIAGGFLGRAISKRVSDNAYKWMLIFIALSSILLLTVQ